jgi:hypothetical protein
MDLRPSVCIRAVTIAPRHAAAAICIHMPAAILSVWISNIGHTLQNIPANLQESSILQTNGPTLTVYSSVMHKVTTLVQQQAQKYSVDTQIRTIIATTCNASDHIGCLFCFVLFDVK